MAEEAKVSPPASDKDKAEDKKDEKKEDAKMTEKSMDARLAAIEGLLEKTAEAIGVLSRRQETYETVLNGVISKEVPPKSMEQVSGGVDYDPTKQERQEKNEKSADTATKPATSTTATAGAFVKKEDAAEKLRITIAKAVETEVEKRVADLKKGVTPVPGIVAGGASPTVYEFMRKAVEEDRRICGGGFNTGGGEHFGLRAGTGNDSAREQMARFMTKSAPWNQGFGGSI